MSTIGIDRSRSRRSIKLATAFVALAATLTALATTPAAASTGQDGAMPSFVESSGCGSPSNFKPSASQKGWLPNSSPIRGPMADFLGRTIGEIRDQLVWWDVPMSDGERIQVHERALPAFEQVTANLAAEEAAGRYYSIRSAYTYGFSPRTISGRYTYSYHAFGTAVDINSTTNPIRYDNKLITNMPQWFVDAWSEAGFCWGGYWNDIKDTMHFAWMGPAHTPGYDAIPADRPVSSSPAGFSAVVRDTDTPFGTPDPAHSYLVADGSSDGAVDVVHLFDNPWGVVIEYSRAGDLHSWCSVRRDHAAGASIGDGTVLMGDWGGTGRNDLWIVDGSGDVSIAINTKIDDFATRLVFSTDLAGETGDIYLTGDPNGDHRADLVVIRRHDAQTSIDVRLGPDFTTGGDDYITPLGDTTAPGWSFALADRDLDGSSDLHVIDPGGSSLQILPAANAFATVSETHDIAFGAPVAALGVSDFDGEGRPDLHIFGDDGRFRAYLGNAAMYSDPDGWFVPPGTRCDSDDIPYGFDGTFRDDDGSVHEQDIESAAARGLTLGCNPPYGDEYCPHSDVTRGEIAAFLDRLVDPPGPGGQDFFTDDAGSVFEGAINAIAAAGIARGCNPPENDRYCPDQVMTRGQLAAFFVRALGLPASADNPFVDDDYSVFESDIAALAASKITMGCNPPANDRFCPNDPVQHDQMASFLDHAARYLEAAA